MATVDKTESCKKQSVAQRLECDYMQLVKFTDDTYQSLSKLYLLNECNLRIAHKEMTILSCTSFDIPIPIWVAIPNYGKGVLWC